MYYIIFLLITCSSIVAAPKDTLTVACLNASPYVFADESSQLTGIFVDFIKLAAEKSEIAIKFELVNWKRAQIQVERGEIDLLLPAVYTEDRNLWLEYSETNLTQFEFSMFKRKSDTLSFVGDMRVFENQIIGKITGGKMHPTFNAEEAKGYFKVEERASADLLVKAVEFERLKYFVSPKEMGLWQIKNNNLDKVDVFKTPIGVTNIYLPLSKKSKKREAWFRLHEKIRVLKEEGLLNEIISKYLD